MSHLRIAVTIPQHANSMGHAIGLLKGQPVFNGLGHGVSNGSSGCTLNARYTRLHELNQFLNTSKTIELFLCIENCSLSICKVPNLQQ